MVEVVVSLCLLTVGILSLITMLPSSMRLASRSDFLGRASGILANQLQMNEAMILNPNVAVTAEGPTTATVYPSEQASGGQSVEKGGDVPFTVKTWLTSLDGGAGNVWLVTVNVAWQGNTTGITESVRVIRQQAFTQ